VQHKYLSDHTVINQIVVLHWIECNLQIDVSESHASLCIGIKTINGRGKINSKQNSFDISHLQTNILQPKYFLST
jgi:hypothetical protein